MADGSTTLPFSEPRNEFPGSSQSRTTRRYHTQQRRRRYVRGQHLATNTVLWDSRCCEFFGIANGNVIPYEQAVQHIHPDDHDTNPQETVIEIPEEAVHEMREIVESPPITGQFRIKTSNLAPADPVSAEDELSALSVPSPGGQQGEPQQAYFPHHHHPEGRPYSPTTPTYPPNMMQSRKYSSTVSNLMNKQQLA